MRATHEVRVLLWVKENEDGCDVGKPFGIHELQKLVAGMDDDALRIRGNRTKGSSSGLVQHLAQGFLHHEVGARCQGVLQPCYWHMASEWKGT